MQVEPLESCKESLVLEEHDFDSAMLVTYKETLRTVWIHEEINKDLTVDNGTILDPEFPNAARRYIRCIVTFFAVADGLIEDILQDLRSRIKNRAVNAWFNLQASFEDIHNLTYSALYRIYADNPGSNERLNIKKVADLEIIKAQLAWVKKYVDYDGTNPPALSIHIFIQAIIECLFFQSEFAGIFELAKQFPGRLPALAKSNEFISRDEGGHYETLVKIYKKFIKNKLPAELARGIMLDAVSAKCKYVEYELRDPVNDKLNIPTMTKYVQFIADKIMKDLDYPVIYKVVDNPIPVTMMQSIGTRSTDFFITTPTEYAHAPRDTRPPLFE